MQLNVIAMQLQSEQDIQCNCTSITKVKMKHRNFTALLLFRHIEGPLPPLQNGLLVQQFEVFQQHTHHPGHNLSFISVTVPHSKAKLNAQEPSPTKKKKKICSLAVCHSGEKKKKKRHTFVSLHQSSH